MNRRFLTAALAASSLVAVALATSEVAQSKPARGQQADAQDARLHPSTKLGTKHVTHTGRATRRRTGKASAPADIAWMADPDQDGRFNYGPRATATERKIARRRTGRRVTQVDVPSIANSNQDDRFNYGPRTVVAKANRRRARDAMARSSAGTTSARRRDDGSSDGPQFARTMSFGGGWSDIVSEARRYIGTNPTSRPSLWCARFMNLVLERSGYKGTGSDMARSFARYGRRVSGPQVGAIAVMSRGRSGGHVGVVSGVDENGNPIVISGNVRNQVAEIAFPRGVVYAYVMPTK